MELNYDDIKNCLQNTVAKVEFTKLNGEQRVMLCTLMEEHLPKIESVSTKPKSNTHLSVWDLEKNGWRSFRIDKVTQVNAYVGDLV